MFFTREQWLDAPPHLPENVPDRKLLFILDDLNRKMYASRVEQSPQANDIGQPTTEPLQKRLLRTLETFETLCGKDDIRVIATARNETVREYPEEPSEWDKLEIDGYPQLWKRFHTYLLAEPEDDAIVSLLQQNEASLLASMSTEDLHSLAKRNDQTFANIVENLRRSQNRKEKLSKENFIDTLKGTWESRYKEATTHYPAAKYIYASIRLLRLAEIELFDFTVKPVAELISGGNMIQKVLNKLRISRALDYLEKTENILKPRDGQIEASTLLIDFDKYIDELGKMLLENPHREKLLRSFQGFAQVLCTKKLSLDLAENLINTAIKEKPELSTLLNDLGAIYLAQGRKDEAIQVYQKSSELFPYCLIPWYRLIQEGEIQEAQKAFTRTLQTETIPSDQVSQWINLGTAYHAKGFYSQAIDAFNAAIRLLPNNSDSWQKLALVYHSQKEYENAIANIKKAIELDPKNITAWLNLGIVYRDSKQYDLAIEILKEATEIDSRHDPLWNALFVVYYDLKQYDVALLNLRKAIELRPDNPDYWGNLALLYNELKQYDDEIQSMQKVIEIDSSNSMNWSNLSNKYYELKRFEEGISYFSQAIDSDPENAMAYHQLGHMRKNLNQAKDAFSAFRRAIDLEPDASYHYKCLAEVYLFFGQDDDAINSYREAAKYEPRDATVWSGLVALYKKQRKYRDAIEAQKKVCEANPKTASVWYEIGVLYLFLEELNEALLAFQRAIELNSKKGNYHASLTNTLRRLGRDAEALEQELITRPLMETENEYNRACFEAICGNANDAIELLKIALDKEQASLEWVRQDPEFVLIREDARFKELVGLD